jgi:hypothetical protein
MVMILGYFTTCLMARLFVKYQKVINTVSAILIFMGIHNSIFGMDHLFEIDEAYHLVPIIYDFLAMTVFSFILDCFNNLNLEICTQAIHDKAEMDMIK